MAYSDD